LFLSQIKLSYLCRNLEIMTTLTLRINEQSKMGKLLLNFIEVSKDQKDIVQVLKEPKETLNEESMAFVKKVKRAMKDKRKGIEMISAEQLWESLK
jgi:DNA polymerase II large subunit